MGEQEKRIERKRLTISAITVIIALLGLVCLVQRAASRVFREGESRYILDSDQKRIIEYEVSQPLKQTVEIVDTLEESPRRDRSYTTVEEVRMEDGSIGLLTIPSISLTVPVYESEDAMEAMEKGVAHFPTTSAWNGNVGLSAHNWTETGNSAYFMYLHKVKEGDSVFYRTALGEREYAVTQIQEISEEDWSLFSFTEENRLTMITCIAGRPEERLCVQAIERERNE